MSAGSLSFAHGLLATGVGDAVVLSKTSPALTVLVASFWLGDKLRVHDIISVRLCCVLDLPLPPFHCHSCLSTVFSLSFHCRQVLLCLGGVALITQSSVEEPVADAALADAALADGVAAAEAGGLGADGAWQENVRAPFPEHTLLGGLLSHNASMHATMPCNNARAPLDDKCLERGTRARMGSAEVLGAAKKAPGCRARRLRWLCAYHRH